MLHVATESLQPHWHCRRAPTRRTSTLGFSLAVWASAAAATIRINRLLLNRRIFLGIPHYFGSCVLQFHFGRHQANQRSEDHHQCPDPDPRNQREYIRLNYSALIVVAHTAEIEVQILVRTYADADF